MDDIGEILTHALANDSSQTPEGHLCSLLSENTVESDDDEVEGD